MHEFNWSPGIGDPTVGGWVTVVLYFLAAVSTWKTAWRAISILFVALGINKQLDLQTALTEFGRVVADYQGGYNERQIVQVWFTMGVAVASILIACVLLTFARKSPAPTWLALVGTTTVLAFVLIRAASFHHIDRFIGETILELRWNWVLEMGGISTVIVASEDRQKEIAAMLEAPTIVGTCVNCITPGSLSATLALTLIGAVFALTAERRKLARVHSD
jgi:hypothetical protein